MRRRRRRTRDIPFGLDSFLDVIANVIGIVIRMIVVVWATASAYHAMQFQAVVAEKAAADEELPTPSDPLEAELARHREQLEEAKLELLEHLRHLPEAEAGRRAAEEQLALVDERAGQWRRHRDALDGAVDRAEQAARDDGITLAELRRRGEELRRAVAGLEKVPAAGHRLYYRVPVSRPVTNQELLFECQAGRVSFIDIEGFIDEVRASLRTDGEPTLEGVTRPIGPFRLHYQIRRLDSFTGTVTFRGGWQVEPLASPRGEALDEAMHPSSAFRQVVDFVDPRQTAVTFCVYPDSFPLYRALRDYLYRRGLEVAGRPIPEGVPIAASENGTASQGQ